MPNPFGMRFMEPSPAFAIEGSYDRAKHMFMDNGVPVLTMSSTTTGSNASTGAWPESDYNEDFD